EPLLNLQNYNFGLNNVNEQYSNHLLDSMCIQQPFHNSQLLSLPNPFFDNNFLFINQTQLNNPQPFTSKQQQKSPKLNQGVTVEELLDIDEVLNFEVLTDTETKTENNFFLLNNPTSEEEELNTSFDFKKKLDNSIKEDLFNMTLEQIISNAKFDFSSAHLNDSIWFIEQSLKELGFNLLELGLKKEKVEEVIFDQIFC
ncbi:hypothetical protein HK099_007571, partial [Clydaea vesicula]